MPYRHRPRRRRFLTDLVEPGGTFDGFDAAGRTNGVWRRPDGDADAEALPGARARRGPVVGSVAAVAVVAAIIGTLAAAGSGPRDTDATGTGEPRRAAADAVPGAVAAPGPAPAPQPALAATAPRPPAVPPRGDVAVLDQGRTPVAARALTERLTAGGWRVTGTAVWRGRVPATTVYHPAGREAEARALTEAFPEIRRVRPSFAGITQARLVVIVVDGPLAPLLPR